MFKNMVIITGTSRGIGKALAEKYLSEGQQVLGIGRTQSISHPNYQHNTCDLSDPEAIKHIQLPSFEQEEAIIFIHNAGTLGEVKRFSDQSPIELAKTFQVNVFAGAALLHQLLVKIPHKQPLKVLFISSGAGKRPIPSWAGYCASKAAVDLFIQTIQLEEVEKGRTAFLCYSFAPGVVDTMMQKTIRMADETNFSSSTQFKLLYENNELNNPENVASSIYNLLLINEQKTIVCSIRDLDLT